MVTEDAGGQTPRIVAILRFGETEHLQAIIDGRVRFCTPEYYRTHYESGFGDADESCSASYRSSRATWEPVILIAGHRIPAKDLIAFTLRGTGEPDRYIQSWVILSIPSDSRELEALKSDLRRAREEFGDDYLCIPHTDIDRYAQCIGESWGTEVRPRIVRYSEDRREWNRLPHFRPA